MKVRARIPKPLILVSCEPVGSISGRHFAGYYDYDYYYYYYDYDYDYDYDDRYKYLMLVLGVLRMLPVQD